MNTFALSIITPNGKQFDDTVESVIAPGREGSFGILAGHTPFVSALKQGIIEIKQSQQNIFFAINSGIVEINDKGSVLMLLDSVQKATSIENAKNLLKSFNPN